ncbi:MAG: prepilin-type N-terminal cleavage/methylation domain-containing protein [Polyangiales bacterium]
MSPRLRRRSRASGGYTLVEVLAALAVLGAGLLGIVAMQGAAVGANQRAHEITMATALARRWQDRLRRDSYQWNFPSQANPVSNLNNTWYLGQLLTVQDTNWIQPPSRTDGAQLVEHAAADYFGNDVSPISSDAYYCVHVRLAMLVPNQLARAEVRVWWYRQGGQRPAAYDNCGQAALTTMGNDTTNVRWVHVTQLLQRHEL